MTGPRRQPLGPRPDWRNSVDPESAKVLCDRLEKADQVLVQLIGPKARVDCWWAVADAIQDEKPSFPSGTHCSSRSIYDMLLLSPGPETLATVWRLGGGEGIKKLALERYSKVAMYRASLCSEDDVDVAALRCGHPLPCPRHRKPRATTALTDDAIIRRES